MPRRRIPLDDTVQLLDRDSVDTLPSPPPAYSKLPIDDDEDSEDLEEDSDEELDDDDDDDYDEDDEEDGPRIDSQLVNDQDWENASGDLTKRYNRLRQHVGALSGPKTTSGPANAKVGIAMPAQNQIRKQHQQRSQHEQQQQSASSANGSATGIHASKLDSSLAALSHRYGSALNLAPVASTSSAPTPSSNFAEPSFTSNAATRKGGSERHNTLKDKSDRATTEQVLDPRTKLVLFKMLGRGLLEKVEGCVSTGKEANVYHALGRIHPDAEPPSPLIDLAIKIYKTSILTFKSRSKYLEGEFRFKNGYSKVKNPRKLVRLWAEKEMRNLKRIHTAGIRCPEPVEVRGNVLVMTFLGKHHSELGQEEGDNSGWEACPRLKDALLPSDKLDDLYIEVLYILRRLYKICKLVHADFSEYNILYNYIDEHLYTIDVSQSVEHDHPHAFDFLRSDIGNADEFFSRRGVRTLGIKRAFEVIVQEWGKNGEEDMDDIRQEVERRFALPLPSDERAEGDMQDEASEQREGDQFFKQAYIPRTLNEVFDPERDVQKVLKGEKDQLIYAQVAGVVAPKATSHEHTNNEASNGSSTVQQARFDHASLEEEDDDSASSDDSASDSSSDEEEDEENDKPHQPRGKRHEDKDAKKERKAAVKEEKREKRKEKIPKAVKKAKVKRTSGKKK